MRRRSIWFNQRLLSVAAGERESYACPHATFDGGDTDPRTLIREYQQHFRAAVLARHPNAPSPARWTGSGTSGEARRLYAVTSYPDTDAARSNDTG